MEQQNDQNLEEISIITSTNNTENNILDVYQPSFAKGEINSNIFYFMQMFELFFITVISTLTVAPTTGDDNSKIKYFNSLISILMMSPSYFNYKTITFFAIALISLLMLLIAILTIYIGIKNRKDDNYKSNYLKIWIILLRLFLPLPGTIIGCQVGYFFVQLTHKIYPNQVFFSIFTGVFWCWAVITSSLLYNSHKFKRSSDICQIRPNYIQFDCFMTILPMVYTIFPYTISVFVSSPSNSIFYLCVTILLSIFVISFVLLKKPYYNDTMNHFVIFLFLIKIPISFSWKIEISCPNNFEMYLLFCLIFMIGSFALIKLLSTCNICHNTAQLTNQQSLQIMNEQTQNNNIHNQDSEIQIDFQYDNDQSNHSSTCDPFINWPYPFNLISLTYTDIFVLSYIILSAIIMTIANSVAAQRMPVQKALPDLIQDRFNVSDYLRTKVANSPFQISNVLILTQISLLVIFIFTVPQYLNLRRLLFIFGTLYLIRGVSFLITSLPAPCSGSPNCPCADANVIKSFNEGGTMKIAFTWLFGIGIFLKYPQCGDLIISGHTLALWLISRTICSVMVDVIPKPFNWLANGSLITLTVIALIYIILSRNHYSIDVWFGFIFSEILYGYYNSLAALSVLPPRQTDHFSLKVVRFVETRPKKRVLAQTKKMIAQNNE